MIVRRCACILAGALTAGCASTVFSPVVPDTFSESEQLGLIPPNVRKPPAVSAPVAPPAVVATPAPAVVVTPPPQPVVFKSTETDVLVQDFARLKRLSASELAREQEGARTAYNQSRSDSARVRYAMALSIPGATGSDDTRALEVLDPIAKTPGASLHPLALLIASYVQEQRRLTSQLASLQQSVLSLQQSVQALQQKLDALKTLERSLTGRDAPRRSDKR